MHKAFTLIELLVVVTIIVILIAMLAPALDRAVYQAQLVQCGGDLKVWGSMGVSFAQDHVRVLPVAYAPGGTYSDTFAPDGFGRAKVLDRISGVTANEGNGQWKSMGTPWQTWLAYGLSDKLAVCPIWKGLGGTTGDYYFDNAPAPQHVGDTAGGPTGGVINSDWGPQVWIGYEWIAGTDMVNPNPPEGSGFGGVCAWGSRPPASKLTNASSNSVMASDLLYYNPAWASGAPKGFRAVAHPTVESFAQPQSMGIAFGDTHVGIDGPETFEKPLIFGDNGSPARVQFSYQGGTSYYWWGK